MNNYISGYITGVDEYIKLVGTNGALVRTTGKVYISCGHSTPSDDTSFLLDNASIFIESVTDLRIRPENTDTEVWYIE